jgi:uncharacterized protein
MKGVDLLVVQPTPFCNINCSYCYLPDRNNTQKITSSIVESIIDRLIADNLLAKELAVVWHAGEPLVLSPGFYRPLFELFHTKLQPYGISVHHTIQTNGTLINQEWCDFINEYSIKTGVSIDGPQAVHDANRKTRSGKGSFEAVMNGIAALGLNKIPYHAIAVVNEKSLEDPAAFFNFFYNNGFYELGLNVEEIEGVHQQSTLFSEPNFEKVKTFYAAIFDLYIKSDQHMHIREFDRCISAIMREPKTKDIRRLNPETHQNIPFAIVSVDCLGNFSTFSPELIGQAASSYNNFIFGNVLQSGFLQPERKEALRLLTSEINNGILKCKKECSFFSVCGGGAPANKFFENGSFNSSETNYCRYNIQVPIELVLSYMEEKLLLV